MDLIDKHLWVVYQSVTSKKVEIREAICLWNDRNFRPDPNWPISKFGNIAFHFVDSEDVIVTRDISKEYIWEKFYPESPFYAFFLTKEEAGAFYNRIQVKKLSKRIGSKRFTLGDTYYIIAFSNKDCYFVQKAIITSFSNEKDSINTSVGFKQIKDLYKSPITANRAAKEKNKKCLEEIKNEYANYILEHKIVKPVKKLEMGRTYYLYCGTKAMKPIFVSSNGLSAIMDNGKRFNIGFGLENNTLYDIPTTYDIHKIKDKIRRYQERIKNFKNALKNDNSSRKSR